MSAEHETYVIKSGGRPSGDPSKYDFDVIQSLLDATDPGKVSAAGYSYNTAARIMAQVAHRLYLVGNGLAGKWEGADATVAQTALGQLYATANELYWRSRQAGAALQTYGAALDQYKGLKWPAGGASPAEDPARQQAAQKVMQSLNQHMGTAWDTMPDKVQSNLPGLKNHREETPYPAGPGPVGTSSGSPTLGRTGGGGASSGHAPQHAPHGGGGLPGGLAGGHGTQLAGAAPSGGGPAAVFPSPGNAYSPVPTGGGSLPAGGGFTPDGMPASFPGGRFGPGSLGGEGAGPSGFPTEEPLPPQSAGGPAGSAASAEKSLPSQSAGGAAGSATAAEEDAALPRRSGLMTSGGAGAAGARDAVVRERNTWLTEDRDIWTAGEDVAPSVLGEPAASGGTGDKETERARTAWLDEEREVWTGPDTAVSEAIGDGPVRSTVAKGAGDATPAVEPDVLDVSQLQELLDAIAPDAADGERPKTPTESAEFFSGGDNAEVNEIGRLPND